MNNEQLKSENTFSTSTPSVGETPSTPIGETPLSMPSAQTNDPWSSVPTADAAQVGGDGLRRPTTENIPQDRSWSSTQPTNSTQAGNELPAGVSLPAETASQNNQWSSMPSANPTQAGNELPAGASLLAVVAIGGLTARQMYRLNTRINRRHNLNMWIVLLGMLVATLMIQYIFSLYGTVGPDWQTAMWWHDPTQRNLTGWIITFSFMLYLIAMSISAGLRDRFLRRASIASAAAQCGPATVEIYTDRIVHIDRHGANTLRFSDSITAYEWRDMFVLLGKTGQMVAFRAEDLPPYVAAYLIDYFRARILRNRMHRIRRFRPSAMQMGLIPMFRPEHAEPAIASIAVNTANIRLPLGGRLPVSLVLLRLFAPMLLVALLLLPVIPSPISLPVPYLWYPVSAALYALILTALQVLLVAVPTTVAHLLASRRKKAASAEAIEPDKTITLVALRSGMVLVQDSGTQYMPGSQLALKLTDQGLMLRSPFWEILVPKPDAPTEAITEYQQFIHELFPNSEN